jgi:hypothetical protein
MDFCEHGNEHSDYIKHGKFIDQIRNCKIFKKNSAPLNSFHPWKSIEFLAIKSVFVQIRIEDMRTTCSTHHVILKATY